MYRHRMSKHNSRKSFRKGTRINNRNLSTANFVMRGGVRA